MQITIPNVPDNLTYSVVAVLIVDIIGTVLLAAGGFVLAGLVSLIVAGSVYWFIYRNLAVAVPIARLATIVIGIVHAFFALVGLGTHRPLTFLFDGACTACLVYAFLQLQRIENRTI